MASYQTLPAEEEASSTPTKKNTRHNIMAFLMLAICIITFVIQTELAQYIQKTTNFSKPYFILYISHSCYIFMIPLQLLIEYTQLENKNNIVNDIQLVLRSSQKKIEDSTNELKQQIQKGDERPVTFIVKTSLLLSVLLTLPAYIWYLSVNLISMTNLTAIYNTGCFFAYFFSVIMLHDRIIGKKVAAVVFCMFGVFFMAYWPGEDQTLQSEKGASSWIGVFVSCTGAALYGFYEVYYKKYATPSKPTIFFANMITSTIGIVTFFILWIPIPILHWSGIETFVWPDSTTFFYILATAMMSVIYNATFMAVIALVHPVFAAVGVMLTVPVVAVADVLIADVTLPVSTVVGSVFILVGFGILNT
ncbi:hypothetical protein BY458DRAFT_500660 [Sporodiniella umbellata]|nr:hypothetical protein BY458DRAFT_500660 [Sporodiniella umbellata]